jgi:hypothetical protein
MNIPTYYVYRPYGESHVSNYANIQPFEDKSVDFSILPMTNLGWRTGMPYDSFIASEGNSWVAGSNVGTSSVPFVQMKKFMPYGSNDLVAYNNPAGSFMSQNGASCNPNRQDAYNLGIGVL